MANYAYPYPAQYSQMLPPEAEYANQGDGYREYYEMGTLKEDREPKASKHKKSTTKFLATKKRQDQIKEILKRDRLGSKRWFFYPRLQTQSDTMTLPATRESSDQRFKVDGNFFRKYKRCRKVDSDAPIMKLKRWELIFYKKLGFIQAV